MTLDESVPFILSKQRIVIFLSPFSFFFIKDLPFLRGGPKNLILTCTPLLINFYFPSVAVRDINLRLAAPGEIKKELAP